MTSLRRALMGDAACPSARRALGAAVPTLSEKNVKFFPNTFGDERQAHPDPPKNAARFVRTDSAGFVA
ncbi:MAG: hypothetical protein HY584_06210, partial [Candidatus Omnitrophica bacterium]|nr:hypothetical protein [Candidatus Omnitrophota bacterium]